jgi:hypothetical protein
MSEDELIKVETAKLSYVRIWVEMSILVYLFMDIKRVIIKEGILR